MTNTLIAKIAAASIAVGSLATDKVNASQNYKYISADKILERAGDALAQAGVMVIPSITFEETVQVDYTDNYGKAKSRFDATVHFAMVLADGESQLEVPWRGRGNDYAVPDKALYKAITSGHKYFLMKLLNIGVGNEDGEHDEVQEPRQAAPRTQSSTRAPQNVATAQHEAHDALWEAEQYDAPADASSKDKVLSAAQLKRINVLGRKLHPEGEWDTERPRYVEWVTKGAVSSSKQLQPSEADTLIAGLERKLAKLAANVQTTHATNGKAPVAA
jgi:hypothetical protein